MEFLLGWDYYPHEQEVRPLPIFAKVCQRFDNYEAVRIQLRPEVKGNADVYLLGPLDQQGTGKHQGKPNPSGRSKETVPIVGFDPERLLHGDGPVDRKSVV